MMRELAKPFLYRWSGDCWQPVGRFAAECDRYFAIGEQRILVEIDHRSGKSHDQQFAIVQEVWSQLPDELAQRFPTTDALRKYALCKAGFSRVKQVALPSRAAAVEVLRELGSDYDLAVLDGNVVTLHKAHSQKRREMDRATFQKAKDAVLTILADLIGVTVEELTMNAGKAA